MNEKDHKTAMVIAQVSVSFGVLVCIAGAWIGLVLLESRFLEGAMGWAMIALQTLPTFVGGLLLIVAGGILRTVTIDSSARE